MVIYLVCFIVSMNRNLDCMCVSVALVSWQRSGDRMSKVWDRHPKNINIKFQKRFCLVIRHMVMLSIHFLLWFTPLTSRQKGTSPLHHDLTSKESYLLKILLSSTPIFNTFFWPSLPVSYSKIKWLYNSISLYPYILSAMGWQLAYITILFFHPKYCHL